MSSNKSNPQWDLLVNVKLARSIGTSALAGQVGAMFFDSNSPCPPAETLYEDFQVSIQPGQIVAVVGPSGAGKSVLLGAVADQVSDAVVLADCLPDASDTPAIEFVQAETLLERLEILSKCGLAEATAMITPPSQLSGGQRHRLAIAVAISRARQRNQPTLVIADEFASTLDPITAVNLSRQIRKLITHSNLGLLVATARPELLAALRPDRVLTKPIAEPVRVDESAKTGRCRSPVGLGSPSRWSIKKGTIADYSRLGRFHYIAGPPAAHKRVYVVCAPSCAVSLGGPALAALLVISPPLINVRGRNIATAGRYCGSDRAASMDLLNDEIECISRVIVHPVYRGCGLAVRLVRYALATADKPLVEALAAMGKVNPFFVLAGMQAYNIGPDVAAVRLTSAAEAVGLDLNDFAAIEPVRKIALRKSQAGRFLSGEIDLCLARSSAIKNVKGSSSKARSLDDPIAAACRLVTRQYVYYLGRAGSKRQSIT